MTSDAPDRHRIPPLTLVPPKADAPGVDSGRPLKEAAAERSRELDWSIYMARAQEGDKLAYRRLLEDIVPYLRKLAGRYLHDRGDIEDAVQDVLLTLHAIRDTYDPARPFGPWLTAIAKRRVVDQVRRRSRYTDHELPLAPEHETFSAADTNLQEAGVDARELREAVERVAAGERATSKLLKLQEMSLQKAAAASGLSIAALKVATHRALKGLRKLLVRQDDRT